MLSDSQCYNSSKETRNFKNRQIKGRWGNVLNQPGPDDLCHKISHTMLCSWLLCGCSHIFYSQLKLFGQAYFDSTRSLKVAPSFLSPSCRVWHVSQFVCIGKGYKVCNDIIYMTFKYPNYLNISLLVTQPWWVKLVECFAIQKFELINGDLN